MSGAYVFIDRSQFPDQVKHDLLASLRNRSINHKFHYDSYKQAGRWLALHEAYSPARLDASCQRIYDDAFTAAVELARQDSVHLIGLGCGGGQKEARLLELLAAKQKRINYTPCDASLPLVLTAQDAALASIAHKNCHSIVCDLGRENDLAATLDAVDSNSRRIISLFGVLPNFEPALLLQRVAAIVRGDDILLISANLAPGDDYSAGMRAILPQYDNPLTREWLFTLLLDLGFEQTDGMMSFEIAPGDLDLQRIVVHYDLQRARTIQIYGEKIEFRAGERLRLFFSYRQTAMTMQKLLSSAGLEISGQWLNASREEGAFLCRKAG